MNFRNTALVVIATVAISCQVVAQTPARQPTLVTPSLLLEHPVTFPPNKIVKAVIMSRNGESQVLMTGSDQLVEKEYLDQAAIFRYQSRSTANGQVFADTVAFVAADFTPLSRTSVSPGDSWRLEFSSRGVSGSRRTASGEQEVSGDFDQPFFDSNILDYLCARLAQMPSGLYSTPLYHERTNSVELYEITVDPVSTVDFGNGSEEAIKVTYKAPDNRAAVVWVENGTARVLREEANPSLGVQVIAEWKYQ